MSIRDDRTSQVQEITAFFSTAAGLITGGIIVLSIVVTVVLGSIFGWF